MNTVLNEASSNESIGDAIGWKVSVLLQKASFLHH